MKECPFYKEEVDCDNCKMKFLKGCGVFSLAADMSIIVELLEKQNKLLMALLEK